MTPTLVAETKDEVPPAAAFSPPEAYQVAIDDKADWELGWNHEDQAFWFYNHSANAKQPIHALIQDPQEIVATHTHQGTHLTYTQDPATNRASKSSVHDLPSQAQKHAALDAVLENRYWHMVPQLLREYSMDLNIQLRFAGKTPLEYATEQEEADVVSLFLDNGADANFTVSYGLGGLPLRVAVDKGHEELVKILVQRTGRVPCTRALARAVSQQDVSIVSILLANNVKCDFEESDRPGPSSSGACNFSADASEPDEFIPPSSEQ